MTLLKYVEKYSTAVVSTAHLPKEIAEYMEERYSGDGLYPKLVFEKLNYGFRIWTEAEEESIPKEIKPLILEAKKAGFRWVEFDCDGDELTDFKVWDW